MNDPAGRAKRPRWWAVALGIFLILAGGIPRFPDNFSAYGVGQVLGELFWYVLCIRLVLWGFRLPSRTKSTKKVNAAP